MVTNIEALDGEARVWIYQANRELTAEETESINPVIVEFVDHWTSHNRDLKAYGAIYHRRFLILMVDETKAQASGCSIDKSVHFVEAIGKRLNIDFFDRMNFAFLEGGVVKTIRMENLAEAINNSVINSDTLVFDNLVNNKREFVDNWLKPINQSWHAQFVS